MVRRNKRHLGRSERQDYSVWRTSSKAYNYHCIRRRWKGFKQVMFWSCFSYQEKGPCHIWEDETSKEKKEAKEWMDRMNALLEPECKRN
jgi:hypothetical protein